MQLQLVALKAPLLISGHFKRQCFVSLFFVFNVLYLGFLFKYLLLQNLNCHQCIIRINPGQNLFGTPSCLRCFITGDKNLFLGVGRLNFTLKICKPMPERVCGFPLLFELGFQLRRSLSILLFALQSLAYQIFITLLRAIVARLCQVAAWSLFF